MAAQQPQMDEGRKHTKALIAAVMGLVGKQETCISNPSIVDIPSFTPFDSTAKLWSDYWARFQTFVGANSIPADKRAQVFLTNQSQVNFKLLSNLASQQTPSKGINELTLEEIQDYMKDRFDPTRYVIRKLFTYKYWSSMSRKPRGTRHANSS